VWGYGKQARISILDCTCRSVCASSCSGKSTSWGGQASRAALNGGGWAFGGRSQSREYVETSWIFVGHGATRVQHSQPWCWYRWAFYIGCVRNWGVACEEGQNLQVCSLDTRTKNRHAAQDDVCRYTQGNLQAMLLNPVCNAWSCHLYRERFNTRSQRLDFVYRSEAGVSARAPHSASLHFFATAHPAASEDYCGSCLESAGEQPLRRCAVRASGGSSKVDCQLSYIAASHSCLKKNSSDVFCRTRTSTEPG